MAKEKYTKRHRRGAVIYTPIAVLLIIIIAIFGISVFFRITEIEVTGAKKYTVEKILSVSGISKGDSLIFVDKKAAEENITVNLPYLNEVVIEKIVPDKVIIKVTESQPIAVISFDDIWWIVDQKAKVLEKTDAKGASEKIHISGIDPISLAEGQKMFVDESQQTKLQYLTNVLSALYTAGISSQVSSIDVSNIANISFAYGDRFTVNFGSGENAEDKLVMINDVMTQLNPDDTGMIDLSGEVAARFIPSE